MEIVGAELFVYLCKDCCFVSVDRDICFSGNILQEEDVVSDVRISFAEISHIGVQQPLTKVLFQDTETDADDRDRASHVLRNRASFEEFLEFYDHWKMG